MLTGKLSHVMLIANRKKNIFFLGGGVGTRAPDPRGPPAFQSLEGQ